MARSIGLIPNDVIRYACVKECATILNVNEQIILNEIKKHLLQRDDNYLEQIKKEKDTTNTLSPSADMVPPPIGTEDNVPPPPFLPRN